MQRARPASTRCSGDQASSSASVDPPSLLDAAQSRLSFHLKVLKEAGLVTDRREGRWMYYTLNPETLAEVVELIDGLASAPSAAERKTGCC